MPYITPRDHNNVKFYIWGGGLRRPQTSDPGGGPPIWNFHSDVALYGSGSYVGFCINYVHLSIATWSKKEKKKGIRSAVSLYKNVSASVKMETQTQVRYIN